MWFIFGAYLASEPRSNLPINTKSHCLIAKQTILVIQVGVLAAKKKEWLVHALSVSMRGLHVGVRADQEKISARLEEKGLRLRGEAQGASTLQRGEARGPSIRL
jgi:hypothetical protein